MHGAYSQYVLSVLGFTYPTVYQGWQTLVGAFILLYLRPTLLRSNDESSSLTCRHFIRLLPTLFVYLATIISASKALATIPVPLFTCAQNASSLCFLMYSLKQVSLFDFIIGLTGLVASIVLFFYIAFFEHYGYHPWSVFFIITSTILEIMNVSNDRNTEVSRLYYKNIFSFVLLMPCSLYLGEAFAALQFKYLDQVGFYAGCLLSGVSGVLLQLYTLKLSRRKHHHSSGALSRLPTILLALLAFDNSTIPGPLWLVIVAQTAAALLFTHNTLTPDPKSSGSQENII